MGINKNRIWGELDEYIEQTLTQEEIASSDLRVAILEELIKARNKSKISQRKLEKLSGVNKATIARVENGNNSPTLDTLMKLLYPLGKTLYVGDLTAQK